jgi:hypothetical protein
MDKICPTCAKDPQSHSFKKLSEKQGVSIFYSQPSASKLYKDTEGILNHMNNALAEIKNKKWICIINGEGFDMKQVVEVETGIGIINLLTEKYGSTLQEIKIINPSWHIKGIVKCMSPFVTEDIKSKVNMMDDRVYSILEFV